MSARFRRPYAFFALCALLLCLLPACAFGKKEIKASKYVRIVTESGSYTDNVGNTYRYSYETPEGWESKGKLHDMIEDAFWDLTKLLRQERESREAGLSLTVGSVHTFCTVNGTYLSIVSQVDYLTDYVEYYTFNYDIKGQDALSVKELCAFAGLTEGAFRELAVEKAGTFLRERYALSETDLAADPGYLETAGRINSPDYEPSLYLAEGGALVWVADIDTPTGPVHAELPLTA